jgi:hypothetical protein
MRPQGADGLERRCRLHSTRALRLALILAITALAGAVSPFVGSALAAGDPSHVDFTLEGCRNDGTITLPTGNGDFICPDTAYTTGNLGKGWNELDLVPFRLTADPTNAAPASQTYTVAIMLDSENSGRTGYDVISVPTLNTSLSDASCTALSAGPQTTKTNTNGTQSIYRLLTIAQTDKTCVYDYYGRLSLGASQYPGSSLQGQFATQALSTTQSISIPVNNNAIAPQELSKDMTATQGSDHVWDIKKTPTPATISFDNTCDPNASTSAGVSVKVEWTKEAATPNGPITVITHVYATNPASRVITTNVTDVIYSGTTQLDSSSSGAVDVPANTANYLVLTHQTTVPAGTTDLNDIATATYTDKVTGVPVPGTTTATASAPVQLSGTEANQSATIKDSESITGTGFSFSADSFLPLLSGSFDSPYIAGSPTTGTVGWTSVSQSGDGSVTFSKTIYVTTGTSGTGKLADTATLTGSDGFTATTDGKVDISASKTVTLTINKSISASLAKDQTFTFHVKGALGSDTTKTVTVPAGKTSASVDVTGLAPDTYTVTEDQPAGYGPVDTPDPLNLTSACSGQVSFSNAFSPASAKAVKVTDPTGSESGWSMTLNGPGTGASGETVVTNASGNAVFTTVLQDGGHYTMSETNQTGWDAQTPTGDCDFTVNYPTDAGKTFTCTFTNVKRGSITVKKQTEPSGDPATFTFTGDLSGNIGDGGQLGPLSVAPGDYSTTEAVPDGWDLKSISCSDSDSGQDATTATQADFKVAAGENVTCTYTDTKKGSITVKKVTDPTTATDKFTFAGDLAGSIGNGEQIGPTKKKPGNYSTTETVPSGWDLTKIECSDSDSTGDLKTATASFKVAAGEDVTCTYTDTQRGKAKVVKTVNGLPPTGTQAFTFQLRQGASTTQNGTTLDTQIANAGNGGVVTFSTLLVPGTTYQLCEIVMPGWSTTLGTFVPGSFLPPDGVAGNPAVDNSILCVNFTVSAGETKTFTVDNTPPPGGRALTIGFWKNWASCANSSGKQKPVLDQTLASFPVTSQFGDTNTTHGVYIGKLYVDTCQEAVAILNKSDVVTGKKMASDPAYNLAAQLLAVELNFQAGAGKCPAAVTAEQQAQALLAKYSFNGTGSYTSGAKKMSAADQNLANQLATGSASAAAGAGPGGGRERLLPAYGTAHTFRKKSRRPGTVRGSGTCQLT